jgi:hypothetical protein
MRSLPQPQKTTKTNRIPAMAPTLLTPPTVP